MKNNITNLYLKPHVEVISSTINETNILIIEKLINEIVKAIKKGNKIIIAGNGGSAADSQHFAAEFTGRYKLERKGLAAISLTTDTSAITAIGNDYGFEHIFSRQLESIANKGDIFIGITTSGNSKNILNACKSAQEKKLHTFGLLGKDGGLCKNIFKDCIIVKSNDSARIQEVHIFIIHTICEEVEKRLFQKK